VGHANRGWCKLAPHPDKKALTWFDEQQVDAVTRELGRGAQDAGPFEYGLPQQGWQGVRPDDKEFPSAA